MHIELDDLLDAIDTFEDSLENQVIRWSDSIPFNNIISRLKEAAHKYRYDGCFGENEALVIAFMNRQPITNNTMKYSNSAVGSLIDSILFVVIDLAELILTPAFKFIEFMKCKVSKKYNTSRTVIAEKIILNPDGLDVVPLKVELPFNSERQYFCLRFPSKKNYDFESAPEVTIKFVDNTSEKLELVFLGARAIGYNADALKEFSEVIVKGVNGDEFEVVWNDTLSAKK